MLKYLLPLVLYSALLTDTISAAEIPPDLAQAVHDYDDAQVNGDAAELRRLIADDYTLVNGGGQLQTKAELIADYTTPGYKIEPFTILEPIERIWGEGAIMGGLVHLRGVSGGKPFEVSLRFIDVWAKRSGKWQVVYSQVTRASLK